MSCTKSGVEQQLHVRWSRLPILSACMFQRNTSAQGWLQFHCVTGSAGTVGVLQLQPGSGVLADAVPICSLSAPFLHVMKRLVLECVFMRLFHTELNH